MTAAALALLIGSIVSWHDQTTGELYCGRLSAIDARAERAWIIRETNPQWYAIEPIANVAEGCPRR